MTSTHPARIFKLVERVRALSHVILEGGERSAVSPHPLTVKLFGWGIIDAVRLPQQLRARTRQHHSHKLIARGALGSVYTITASITHHAAMALLPITAVRASNAWHTDENCGCHNLNSAWGIRTMFERGYNASLAHRANDFKTLKDKSKQTKSEKKLRQALTYELWRSLRAYRTQQISTREEAEQGGRHLCGNQSSGAPRRRRDVCFRSCNLTHWLVSTQVVKILKDPNQKHYYWC